MAVGVPAMFDNASIGIIITDAAGVIERVNRFTATMFGYGPGELIGRTIEVLVPPDVRTRHIRLCSSYCAARYWEDGYYKTPFGRSEDSFFFRFYAEYR